jgi:DNA-binding IclR family transcriptional regulator
MPATRYRIIANMSYAIAEQTNDPPARRNPVAKALRLLEWMTQQPAAAHYGVREMAAGLGWTPSTVHRILVLLETDGWITSPRDTGRYQPSARLLKLALAAARSVPLVDVALPRIEALVEECDETALLGFYDGARMEMSFIAAVESRQTVRYVADSLKDEWAPLNAGASGLAIFAFLSEADRDRVVARKGLSARTTRTIVDVDDLQIRVAEIRSRGYACTVGERTPGAAGIAAPIFDPEGYVAGDVLITVPEHRFGPESEARLADAVMACAREISEELARLDGSAR